MDGTHHEVGLRFDEFSHGLGKPGQIPLIHLIRIPNFLMRGDKANVREGIDAEERETRWGFSVFDCAEEQFAMMRRRAVLIVGDVGGSHDCEFAENLLEAELWLVVELNGVEEDEKPVGSWGFHGGKKSSDGLVVEVD